MHNILKWKMEKFMNKCKQVLRCICFLVIAGVIFAGVTHIFERKTLSGPWNYTIKVNGYFNSKPNSMDVVCLGSSHMFCSINPIILEETYGISAYVLATQQQTVKASYYYMLEALKTQSPKAFIFETFMVNWDKANLTDAIIGDATEPLPMSMNKLQMIADLTEGREPKIPYFLTLFKYHDRWKELQTEDFTFNRNNAVDETKGYVYLTDVTPVTKNLFDQPPVINDICSEDLEYLEKMVALCRENNIQLILLYAPFSMDESNYNTCYTVEHFADEHELDFINGYELITTIDFDFDKDFYDVGHMNCNGSSKLTEYVGNYLIDRGYLQ